MKNKKEILNGHKKIGNKFVPPFLQLAGLAEVSYVNQILPEIIWIGFMNEAYGYRRGIEVCLELCREAQKVCSVKKITNFAVASSFNELQQEEKESLVFGLKERSILAIIQPPLAPLINLYSDFPMSFLSPASTEQSRTSQLATVRACVDHHLDKYQVPAMAAQAAVIYIRAMTGGLSLSQNIEVPDLDAIIASPNSEAGKRAAGFVRATILTEFGELGRKDSWASSFWDQNYKLDGCKFDE